MVAPMRQELVELGFEELKDSKEVDEKFSRKGTTLLVINSVCGCAAANARPAVKMSLKANKKPTYFITAFAGVDREATDKAREYTLPYPPSSPCIALFKDGALVHMLERHHIEGRPAEMISENLKETYEEFC
ncbi:UPF0403 protein yphP [Elysia marginata]|uniref:UPF0403 protein yphP n=1 Tax=Elysia marginata TaxID=1093978 RepID=A0AAV4FJV7_9GAST|nr:UPF0403 protein yphP [Elysia marginata]